MNLFLLRHGKACARGPKWRPDDTRPLTRDGEKKMFAVARGIQSLDLSFDLILTSPYIRAFRTAEILGEVFESKKVFETKNLIAEADPRAVIGEINENFPDLTQIVLVGHEPFMTRLISILLSGKDDLSIDLRKGGFCKLSVTKLCFGRCACLDWLLTPRQLARLARGLKK
jgi:phosphohistidine phosphatase